MRQKMIVALLVTAVVILAIAGCGDSPMAGQDNLTYNFEIGKVHNKVLESLNNRKYPLFDGEGLVPYANLENMLSVIYDSMIEQGFDPAICSEIVPLVFVEFTNMELLKEIDGQVYLDIRENDLALTTWDYLVENDKVDEGIIYKLSPVFDLYRLNGDCPELRAMVADLNSDLNLYNPDTVAKILTFKDVFEHSEDYWELYGITGPGSISLCDAAGAIIGGVSGGIIGGGIFAGGWSYLHEKFIAWCNEQ